MSEELPSISRREMLKLLGKAVTVLGGGCTPLNLSRFPPRQDTANRGVGRNEKPDQHDQKRSLEWLIPQDIQIHLPRTWNTWTKGELPVPTERFPIGDLHHLVVHHTALRLADMKAPDQLQALCKSDGMLPYHVVIGPDGVVYAREQSGISKLDKICVAPHAGKIMNHTAMGICLLGDYEPIDWKTGKKRPTDTVSEKALRSLVYVLAQLQSQYDIKPKYGNDVIIPHRGVATLLKDKDQATDCPGSLIMEKWDGVMREVRRTAKS